MGERWKVSMSERWGDGGKRGGGLSLRNLYLNPFRPWRALPAAAAGATLLPPAQSKISRRAEDCGCHQQSIQQRRHHSNPSRRPT